jgi:mannosylglycerate hydrolase
MRTLHVISHTHWDREWYRTFQQFRLKLVQLVDGLLDILERDPEFKYFMLDGQTIVLDDYLLMRPEKEVLLREHIQNGRIVIGPWHILPDMFLVGPEAHIHNLLEGDRTCRKFGPKMMIGYMPDSFGHIAQMPQILRGFNIDVACLWRGVEDAPAEFWWQSPDGSRVLMAYLRDSYSNGAALPTENLPAFEEAIATLGQSLADHSTVSDQLIMLGTDHMQPPPNTSAAIAYAEEVLKDTHVIHSTLPQYVAAIKASIESQKAQIPVIADELRACKRMPLLPGVPSTRIWIKQRNTTSENLLTKWVEPFTTFQELATGNGHSSIVNRKSEIIRQTWRLLMENHPHDSICGCSIDQVHDEMKIRFDQVDQIGEELIKQSLAVLADSVQTDNPKSKIQNLKSAIIVFNPHPFPLSDAVSAEISLPPGVAAFEITDENGRVLPHEMRGLGVQQLLNSTFDSAGFRSTFGMVNEGRVTGLGVRGFTIRRAGDTAHLDVILAEGEPDKTVWERGQQQVLALFDDPAIKNFHVYAHTTDAARVFFTVPAVPGLGWRTCYVRAKEVTAAPLTLSPLARAVLPLAGKLAAASFGQALITRLQTDPASKPPYAIENDFFKVDIEPAGTLAIFDKQTKTLYSGMNRFVDGGDCGDEYNYSPPELDDPQPISRLISASVHRSAVRQTLTLNLALKTPATLSADRKSRSRETVEIPIKSVITLTNGVPRVDVHTEINNTAQDHRLRVHFPTPFKVDQADYDGHFEISCRKIGDLPAFDRQTWVEDPRPEVPQRAFTEVSEENRGLTLANRGLPEVEVLRSRETSHSETVEIALTLLRCVGWLSRDDFQTRRGHAGPDTATPGAQMPGQWSFDYAIIPHGGQKHILPHVQAYAFETPLRAVPASLRAGNLPEQGSFVIVTDNKATEKGGPTEFIVTAVKQAENGNGWLVRGYNPGHDALEVTLTPFKRFKSAARVNLAEQKMADLTVEKATGSVNLPVNSCEIVSVLFNE